MKGTNNNLIEDLKDSLKEYLESKNINYLNNNGEDFIYSSILNTENVDDEKCSCYFDFSFLRNGINVIFAIGYFPLPPDMSILKVMGAINNINHYAINFNCSLERPEKNKDYFLVSFKYSKILTPNEIINYNTWSGFYNNVRFITLSLYHYFNISFGLYPFYNSKDLRYFFDHNFLDYTIDQLERFKKEFQDKIFKEDDNDRLQNYEDIIQKYDTNSLYNELNNELDRFKREKDDTRLKIISKYLK